MYNDASTARESRKTEPQDTSRKLLDAAPKEDMSNNSSSNIDERGDEYSVMSTTVTYAEDLEELIRAEQLNRVALIKQITSEREQRAAVKQLLSAVSQNASYGVSERSNQLSSEDMQASVRELLYDAVIGRQMIEASLEEEVHLCEKDFNDSYRKVVNTLRDSPYSPEINAGSIDDHEEKISLMMETAGASACPDEMLRIEVSEGFRKVFIEFHEDLKLYEREFIVAASATDAAGTVEAAKSKTGGWDNLDEERFVKVLHSYERKHGTGKKPQLLYDTLALVLPNVSLVEIKKHVKFHQHLRFHLEKKKDRQREFQRRLEDLHSEAIEKFRGTIELEREKTHKLQQLNALQHHCDQLHDEVSQWRVTKEAKERIEQQQREIEQMLEQQKQQEETLRKQRKLDQQKLIVAEYKKDKAFQKIADDKLLMEEEQQRETERALQSGINAERVSYRHQEFQRKLDDMKLEDLRKAQLEEQRLAKLNELKEKTSYAQIIANITPDPERTRQETAAFRANVEAAQEALPINETGLFPSHGYDCETLFKNARFKLGIALRPDLTYSICTDQNAGLNSSEYAREALANVKVCNVGAYRNHVAEPTKLW